MFVRTRPTLAVTFQQRNDAADRLMCGGGAFQPEAQQVHAQQAGFWLGAALGEHRLVADHNTVFVGSHLGAPHPPGA